jgi:hypothetical protein
MGPFILDFQWLRLARSKGPVWVGVYPPFTWRRKKNRLPKRRHFIFLYFTRTIDKVQKTISSQFFSCILLSNKITKWRTPWHSTYTLPRRSLLSKCHTVSGCAPNVIPFTAIRKVRNNIVSGYQRYGGKMLPPVLGCTLKIEAARYSYIFELNSKCNFISLTCKCGGTRWHCATSRKVAGSIPDGVIGIFHWLNPLGRTMALGSTLSLTEMTTRNISWG